MKGKRTMKMTLLVCALLLCAPVAAAPNLFADPYPDGSGQPDTITMTVNGGAAQACELVVVLGGKQPKCDLAGLTAAGTYTLVMTACRAGSIVNVENGATNTQEACASSVPFSYTLRSGGVAAPVLTVAP